MFLRPKFNVIARSLQSGLRAYSSQTVAPSLKVWWDSSCPLCTKEITLLKGLDTKHEIDFIALTPATPTPFVPSPNQEGCPLTKKELLARFHAQEDGKDVVSGARAFAAMWKRMPQKQLRWIGETAERNNAFMGILEVTYRSFLIVRPGLQWIFRKFGL